MHFPYLQHRKMKNGWLLWHYSLHKTDPKKVYGCTGPFLQRYFWKPPICHQFSPFHNQNSKPTKAKFIPGSDFHYGWSWKNTQSFQFASFLGQDRKTITTTIHQFFAFIRGIPNLTDNTDHSLGLHQIREDHFFPVNYLWYILMQSWPLSLLVYQNHFESLIPILVLQRDGKILQFCKCTPFQFVPVPAPYCNIPFLG